MGNLNQLYYSLLLIGGVPLNAQEADIYVVNIKGKIISDDGGEVVPYAHVINPRVHGGTTSNVDGMFSISMLTEDTLTIRAIGFVDYQFTINEFPPKELYEIQLKPVRYLIDEVTISDNTQLKNGWACQVLSLLIFQLNCGQIRLMRNHRYWQRCFRQCRSCNIIER